MKKGALALVSLGIDAGRVLNPPLRNELAMATGRAKSHIAANAIEEHLSLEEWQCKQFSRALTRRIAESWRIMKRP